VPIAIPINKQVIVKAGRFESSAREKSRRKSEKAGKSISIDNATALVRSAVKAMNSL
jgi:hypothetical protein